MSGYFDSGYLYDENISLYHSHRDSTTNIIHDRGSGAYADLTITIMGPTFRVINRRCRLDNIAK